MALPPIRAMIFDLDEALLDRRGAWLYAVEESIAAVCGRRLSARELVAEYRSRPWAHALSVLLADRAEQVRCEEICVAMYERSAMKRLLVHEGIGMALDAVRAHRVEMGAISREPHRIAIRQVESTGLDRFLAVLSATPEGADWNVAARLGDCLAFLERTPRDAVYVGCDARDLESAAGGGFHVASACYSGAESDGFEVIESPAALTELLAGLKRGL